MTKCLCPDCERADMNRGLCSSHYQSAFRLVKMGKVTWKQLEKSGKCNPAYEFRSKGKNANWLLEGVK